VQDGNSVNALCNHKLRQASVIVEVVTNETGSL
jgi:hypothetical protein